MSNPKGYPHSRVYARMGASPKGLAPYVASRFAYEQLTVSNIIQIIILRFRQKETEIDLSHLE